MQATFIPSVLYLFKLYWEKTEVPLNFSYASNESHWASCFGVWTLLSWGPLRRKKILSPRSEQMWSVVTGKSRGSSGSPCSQVFFLCFKTSRLVQHRAAAGGQDWLHTWILSGCCLTASQCVFWAACTWYPFKLLQLQYPWLLQRHCKWAVRKSPSHRACLCTVPISKGFCITRGSREEWGWLGCGFLFLVKANKLWQVLKQKGKGKILKSPYVSWSVLSPALKWELVLYLRASFEDVCLYSHAQCVN